MYSKSYLIWVSWRRNDVEKALQKSFYVISENQKKKKAKIKQKTIIIISNH